MQEQHLDVMNGTPITRAEHELILEVAQLPQGLATMHGMVQGCVDRSVDLDVFGDELRYRGGTNTATVTVTVTNDPYKVSRAVCVGEPYPGTFHTDGHRDIDLWLCIAPPGANSEYQAKANLVNDACRADGGYPSYPLREPTVLCTEPPA